MSAGGVKRRGELAGTLECHRRRAPLPPLHPAVLRTLDRSPVGVPFRWTIRKHYRGQEEESEPGRRVRSQT